MELQRQSLHFQEKTKFSQIFKRIIHLKVANMDTRVTYVSMWLNQMK